MGGFTVDGCGARDYIKKLKYLGKMMCPNCKNVHDFYLIRAKFKISVFYIPTVTLKEKYAIMCDGCGQGTIIEESEMHRIMASDNQDKNIAYASSALNRSEPVQPESPKCQKCGAPLEGPFCGVCGTKQTETPGCTKPVQPPVINKPSSGNVCCKCGAPLEGPFCGVCGTKQPEKADAQPPVINIPSSGNVCCKCGAPLEGPFCGVCGTKQPEKLLPDAERGSFDTGAPADNPVKPVLSFSNLTPSEKETTAPKPHPEISGKQTQKTLPKNSFFHAAENLEPTVLSTSAKNENQANQAKERICPNCKYPVEGEYCGFCGTKYPQ